ncbi:glycosyl transferase family 36, partial [candidate division KSB1 bacterium]
TNAKAALKATQEEWRRRILDNIQVLTPDDDFNLLVNGWMKYQIYINNHWGRSASFYHEGSGEFGYRNTAQDAFGITSFNPRFAKEILLKLASIQRSSGQVLPGWSLVSGVNTGRPTSDFPMWLPFLLISYIKETGDFEILQKSIEFFDGGEASLYEHAIRAMNFLADIQKGERGLPLMETQDWNDAFDRVGIEGRGESVMLAMGLVWALEDFSKLAYHLKDMGLAQSCLAKAQQLKDILNHQCWDGEWYVRAYTDYGEVIGSSRNEEGKIYANTQSWAILSRTADTDRMEKILQAIDTHLETPYGPVMFAPPYTRYDSHLGRITGFAPGTKENAAIFSHVGAFKVVADIVAGRAEKAYRIFHQLLPISDAKDPDVHKTEPYVFSEYVIGPGNPRYGEGAFSWLTGTAAWMFVAATQWILGIRPTYTGLLIDPCIPSYWEAFEVRRPFRGDVYQITVENSKRVERGIQKLFLDGIQVEPPVIIPKCDGKVHQVKAIMG